MGMADTDRTFHKHVPVTVQRKKLFGKTPPHKAYVQEISLHGCRVLTTEEVKENCHLCITFRDPDSDTDRILCAKVTSADCILYHGKRVFEAHTEFLKLTKHDQVMLQNIFYASPK